MFGMPMDVQFGRTVVVAVRRWKLNLRLRVGRIGFGSVGEWRLQMGVRPLDVARWIVSTARDQGAPVTPLKLQKLLYYAHGYHLARTGRPLLDEGLHAWDNGPVCPSVYHAFKAFGDNPIRSISVDKQRVEGNLGADVLDVLHDVWQTYGDRSASELWESTHTEPPWDSVYVEGVMDISISDDTILDFFRGVPDAIGAVATPREQRFAASMARLRELRGGNRANTTQGDSGIAGEIEAWSDLRADATTKLVDP